MCVTRLIMTGRTRLAVATASTPFQKQTCHLTVKCELGDSGVSSLGGAGHLRPTELLMPLSQLVEAKVLYCAVPAMGHNQVCVQIFHDFSSDLDIGMWSCPLEDNLNEWIHNSLWQLFAGRASWVQCKSAINTWGTAKGKSHTWGKIREAHLVSMFLKSALTHF